MAKTYTAADYPEILGTILGEYHKKHDLRLVPIKIDYLQPMMCQRGVADDIHWEEVEFQHKYIGAMVEFYSSLIAYKPGLTASITFAS